MEKKNSQRMKIDYEINVHKIINSSFVFASKMKAFCHMFKERCDQYIDQSDALYAYLIEPFLILKDNDEEEDCGETKGEIPQPSYISNEPINDQLNLPENLFEI